MATRHRPDLEPNKPREYREPRRDVMVPNPHQVTTEAGDTPPPNAKAEQGSATRRPPKPSLAMNDDRKMQIVVTSATLEAVAGLKKWAFFIEAESTFQTRDRLGTVRSWKISAPVNDHQPAHIHARKDNAEITICLDDLRWKRKSGKPKDHEVRNMLKDFEEMRPFFRRQYDAIRRRHRIV